MRPRPSYIRWGIAVLAALLPVAAIGVYSYHTAERSLERMSRDNRVAIAAAAGEMLRQQLQRSIQLSRVVAGFPVFGSAVRDRDVELVRERLRRLLEASGNVDRAFVVDTAGTLWCDWPIATESLNRNFAHRDYFIGVSKTWDPYVSEVFRRQADPQPLVIAVATPVRDDTDAVVGILVLQHRLETVMQWLRRIDAGTGGSVMVLDYKGVVVGHGTLPRQVLRSEYSQLEPVRQAMRGRAQTLDYPDPITGKAMIATFQPVAMGDGRYWVVIAQQDRDEAFAPTWELLRQISLAVAIVAALALAAAIALARISERNRQMGFELAQRNWQLQQAISAEREGHDALKTAQSHLVQSEKMVSLGQMVAGIAHEINNPLCFVSNNIAVLQRDLLAICDLLASYQQGDAQLQQHRPELMESIRERAERLDLAYTLPNIEDVLARSREGLRRIQQIVIDLRDFARLDENRVVEADLNAGVESTANIVRGRAKRKQVQLELTLAPIPPVACCLARVNQVVMNLLSNAIDACEPGGQVCVRTYEDDGDICVAVIDNGGGIDPAIVSRIFDPFFTTKPQGEGTGLGLSISYGIARDHGGSIEVESSPGKGSTFTLRLPRHRHQTSGLA